MSVYASGTIRTPIPADGRKDGTSLLFLNDTGALTPAGYGSTLFTAFLNGGWLRLGRAMDEARPSLETTGAFETSDGVIYSNPRSVEDGDEFVPSTAFTVNDPSLPTVLCHSHRMDDEYWVEMYAGATLDAALNEAISDSGLVGSRAKYRRPAREYILGGGAFAFGLGHVFALPVTAVETVDGYRAHAAALMMAGVKDMRAWRETYALGLPVEYAIAMSGGAA